MSLTKIDDDFYINLEVITAILKALEKKDKAGNLIAEEGYNIHFISGWKWVNNKKGKLIIEKMGVN